MEKIEKINFDCTACGKCCDKPPRVNFYEMLELSSHFVFQTAHHAVLSSEKQLLNKEILNHYQKIGHTIMLPELESSMYYFIDFIPLQLKSYNSCSKLKDNLCSIYGSRPNFCRLLPGSASVDLENQIKPILFFKEMTELKDWNCNFSETATLYYDKLEFASFYQNNIYGKEVSAIREITDIFVDFLSEVSDARKNDHFKALFTSLEKNSLMISDVFGVLHAMIKEGLITENLLEQFVTNQINLIHKELDYSKGLKNKDNLEVYRFYKKVVVDYENYLKAKPYKIEQSNEVYL